ncbi:MULTISPECIES: hypothetical protein [unclassified Veillonella]|uniref:hypothetical protein n=1 Tax=unclassified Veillonella TaxID=2630086 RepID=UPI00033DF671|nr:hypothetical protein [Veillonella sp. CAG:933]CCX53821.1 unknown [Veillonella sp. CAG:933]
METLRAYIESFGEDAPVKLLYEVYGTTSEVKSVLQYCVTSYKTAVEVMKEENVYPETETAPVEDVKLVPEPVEEVKVEEKPKTTKRIVKAK